MGGPLSTDTIIVVPPAPVKLLPPLALPAFAAPLSALPPPVDPVVDPPVPLDAPPAPLLVTSPPAPVGSTVSSEGASPLPALQPESDKSRAQARIIKEERIENLTGGL